MLFVKEIKHIAAQEQERKSWFTLKMSLNILTQPIDIKASVSVIEM